MTPELAAAGSRCFGFLRLMPFLPKLHLRSSAYRHGEGLGDLMQPGTPGPQNRPGLWPACHCRYAAMPSATNSTMMVISVNRRTARD